MGKFVGALAVRGGEVGNLGQEIIGGVLPCGLRVRGGRGFHPASHDGLHRACASASAPSRYVSPRLRASPPGVAASGCIQSRARGRGVDEGTFNFPVDNLRRGRDGGV